MVELNLVANGPDNAVKHVRGNFKGWSFGETYRGRLWVTPLAAARVFKGFEVSVGIFADQTVAARVLANINLPASP